MQIHIHDVERQQEGASDNNEKDDNELRMIFLYHKQYFYVALYCYQHFPVASEGTDCPNAMDMVYLMSLDLA